MWKNTKNKGKKTAEHKKICYNIEKCDKKYTENQENKNVFPGFGVFA